MLDPLSLLSIGGSLLGNLFGSNSAATAQARASQQATDLQREQFNTTQSMLAPQIAAGNTARGYQLGLLGLPGGDQNASMAAYRGSPGYQGGLAAGRAGINQGAANSGLMRSSGNIGDLGRFGSQYDAGAFGDYFGRLGGISGAGANATGALAGAGQHSADSLANIALNQGNNQATNSINMANAGTGAAQNLMDLYYRNRTPSWASPGWSDGGAAFGGGHG